MNFAKRITSVALAAVTAMSLCTIQPFSEMQTLTAFAESYSDEAQYGDYLWYKNVDEDKDGTYDYVAITDCDESAKEVEIPREIDGLSVVTIAHRAFENCDGICSITIPDSVKEIGMEAFYLCENLLSITIENSECVIYDSKSTISGFMDYDVDDYYYYYFGGTIYGYENSTAQAYAEKYDYKFECVYEEELPEIEYIFGDVNYDGKLTVSDAAFLATLLVRGEVYGNEMVVADFNGDGIIDIRDASAIATCLASPGGSGSGISIPDKSDTGHSISIGNYEAPAGNIVNVDIYAECNNYLESFMFEIDCDDICEVVGISSEVMSVYNSDTTIAGFSSGAVADGCIATISIKIPDNAAPGNVYDIKIGDVETFAEFAGDDYADSVNYNTGYISVVEGTTVPVERPKGDANGDDKLSVSDAAFIARILAKRETIDAQKNPYADYNKDGKVTVADAAAIARELAKKK